MTTIKSILEDLAETAAVYGDHGGDEGRTATKIRSSLLEIEQLIEEAKPDKRVNPSKSGYSAASITHGYKNTSSDYFDDGFNGGVNVFSDNLKKILK